MKLNKLKVGTILAIMAVMIGVSTPIKSNAQETINKYDTMESKSDNNKNIQVEINEDIKDKVSQEEIDILIDEAKYGDEIIIHDIINNEEDYVIVNNIKPRIDTYRYTKTSKSNVKTNQNLGSEFVCSVAKGQTKKVKRNYKLKAEVKGTYDNFLQITGTGSVSYSVEDTFKGPKESSKVNSREYRVKFIGDKGNYTQRLYEVIGPKEYLRKTHKGSYKAPKKGLMYSIDRKI